MREIVPLFLNIGGVDRHPVRRDKLVSVVGKNKKKPSASAIDATFGDSLFSERDFSPKAARSRYELRRRA